MNLKHTYLKYRYIIKSPWVVLLFDILMVPIAWVLAYLLRYNLNGFPHDQFVLAYTVFPFVLLIQIMFYWYFGLYRGVWRFASLPDLIRIIKAVGSACIILIIAMFFFIRLENIPRMIFPLYGLLLVSLLGGARLFYRYLKDKSFALDKGKRVLIVGAGSAGEMLVRDLLRSHNHDYQPVAFLDDALSKQGKEIHGIRVVGVGGDLPSIVKKENIDLVVIAIPSANANAMRQLVDLCNAVRIPFQTLPSLAELASGNITFSSLREVAVEDLLGREPIAIDWQEIISSIAGKSIVVTGGGGSIGSELCRQIAKLQPAMLTVIESSEFNLYKLEQELIQKYPQLKLVLRLISVSDQPKVQDILVTAKPEMVFHAAAYKHVPMLEKQVYVALNNNVLGTKSVAEAAIAAGVKKFILISTDKAVKPANVMGASKRLAETVCQNLAKTSETKFITVRFGNVFGSSGSVVPLFKQQLAVGGPLTVTHPEVTRFFMTIPEACCLILQACMLGNGGEIFVLDMGEPIKIKYLAEQMIRLSGKEPDVDIKIIYTGLRPGEKLYEELFYQDEEVAPTKHKKILQAKNSFLADDFVEDLHQMETALKRIDSDENLYVLLKKLVPEFCI